MKNPYFAPALLMAAVVGALFLLSHPAPEPAPAPGPAPPGPLPPVLQQAYDDLLSRARRTYGDGFIHVRYAPINQQWWVLAGRGPTNTMR